VSPSQLAGTEGSIADRRLEGTSDEPERLLCAFDEWHVLEATLYLAPLAPLDCARSAYVIVECKVLKRNEERRKAAVARASLCQLLQDEKVCIGRVTCEVLEVLPELIDLDENGPVSAQ
jgi:hypothetical protein